MRRIGIGVWIAAALAVGCRGAVEPPVRTGAEDTARTYFQALLHRDWPTAYAALDPRSQARCGVEQFAVLAQAYRCKFGFEPSAVHIRSCEEQGSQAIAHVVFTGRAAGHARFFKDAVTLHRGEASWGVAAPPRFGLPH
jgi:hypothetical protein